MKTLAITRVLGTCSLLLGTSAIVSANYDQMIVFGDSLSDNGNLSSAAGPGVFSALNYDPSRATDGPTTTPASSISGVTVEQLNHLLGLPALMPSNFGGNDYAWGRATTDFNPPDIAHGVTPGTSFQLFSYLVQHHKASANSLYVVWAGSEDLLDATTTDGIQAAETAAIANLTLQIGTLLNGGAKNVLWFDLPDLSLTPEAKLEGPVLDKQLHDSSLKFQSDWSAAIQQLEAIFPAASITGIDTYNLIQSIANNPESYGLDNVTDPAQGQVGVNPDRYLFWDTLHPTTKADSILADLAYHALPVPEASGSVYLGLALFGLILQRAYSFRRRPQS